MAEENTPANFWKTVKPGSAESCWPWPAHCDRGGYGEVRYRGVTWRAHRLAYTLARGPIPKGVGHHGVVVMHTCDNRSCCNPAHLALGTNALNLADMAAKGRSTKGRCTNPNGSSRLDPETVLAIRSDPRRPAQIARAGDYGLGTEAIRRIKARVSWAWLEAA